MGRYFIRIVDNKILYRIILLMIGIFLLTRCVYLDRDLPPTGICAYIAIDETAYTAAAFNLYHFGDPIHNPVPLMDSTLTKDIQTQPSNILEIIMTYLSLKTFGNNYYGIRMASVIAALFVLVSLFLVLKQLKGDEQLEGQHGIDYREYIVYFIMLYLLIDFSFLMAGRVAEPTIFRLMALSVLLYIGSRPCFTPVLKTDWHSLLLGFVSMAAVVFVYVYNAFILVAMVITIAVWSSKDGLANVLKQTTLFLLGGLICLAWYEFYIQAFFHTDIVNYYRSLAAFRNRIAIETNMIDSLKSFLVNIAFIPMTNIFRFNIALLFAFLVSLPAFVHKLVNKRTNFDILVFNLLLFVLVQSVIVNDYPLRKLVIMLPMVLLVIAITLNYYRNIDIYKHRYFRLYWFACFILTLAIWAVYLFSHINGEHYGEIRNAMYLNLIVFIIMTALMTVTFVRGKTLSRPVIIICGMIMLLPNLYLDNRYIFSNPTFYYRDAMIGMSAEINNSITVGGCSHAFRLYNSSIPVLDGYISLNNTQKREYFDRNFDYLLENSIARYSIAYVNDSAPDSALSSAYLLNHGLRLVEEYELGNHVNARVGLYEFAND